MFSGLVHAARSGSQVEEIRGEHGRTALSALVGAILTARGAGHLYRMRQRRVSGHAFV
jgi:hypothetical protein